MKTKIAVFVIGLIIGTGLFFVPNNSHAGFLSGVSTSGWDTTESDHYKLEVNGFDLRVYEWTPNDNPNVRCVFVSGNTNSTGVACYEVSDQKKK